MAGQNWPDLLTQLVRGTDLSPSDVEWAMSEILDGAATPVQVAGFAVALRAKGETVAELRGLADTMLSRATPVPPVGEAVDVVGSGGDRANTVNISTMAAVVAAAAGARVAKHGNRAASSACGTADVLEALGVNLDPGPQAHAGLLEQVGITFFFAAGYHPAFRHAAQARRELGVATSFNLLGPLTNPARPSAQAVGIADRRFAPLVAGVIAERGHRGLVFHGGDGLDELTTTTSSTVWVIADGQVTETTLDPLDLGLPRASPDDLVGGEPALNAEIARRTLAGEPGPVRDIVALNAAAALLAFAGPDPRSPLAEQFRPHLARAVEVMESSAASRRLVDWARLSQESSPA
ncbi:anthranilate phosphoribosyltransferase [Naumannella halotolerans]|uniref:Anthranilate phosphoribosyltransferase n=1 Tax=Naumannella halotolerans TaxID=993414 RepID=A0A4R7J5W3_9ACTN|nr:anthranilate phosphoribosyltransferase [Naumannella halotolerans]TDT32751.1 anthranilate phosphoribosyltransferase [Naumannella halotolerans]